MEKLIIEDISETMIIECRYGGSEGSISRDFGPKVSISVYEKRGELFAKVTLKPEDTVEVYMWLQDVINDMKERDKNG